MSEKIDTLREIVSKNGEIPPRHTIREHLAEIESLKKDGFSYRRIHQAMRVSKKLSCSYSGFVRILKQINDVNSKEKNTLKTERQWDHEPDSPEAIFGPDD